MERAQDVPLFDWFATGWAAYRRDPYPLMGASLLLTAFSFGSTALSATTGTGHGLLLEILVSPVLYVGWCYMCLRQVRGEDTWATEVFAAFSRFASAWLTYALYFLIVLAGVLMLVVPGLYWGSKYGLCFFSLIEKRQTVSEAVAESGVITKGNVGKIFCVLLVAGLLKLFMQPFLVGLGVSPFSATESMDMRLVLLGALPFLLTLLVVTPWMGTTLAAAYDSLRPGAPDLPNGESRAPGP